MTTLWDDTVISDVDLHVGWLDRLRILVHGRVHLIVRTKTEHEVGRTECEPTTVRIPHILPRRPRPVVFMEADVEVGATPEPVPTRPTGTRMGAGE